MLDKYKISSEEIEKTNEVVAKVNRENLYSNFVSSQEQGFFRFMDYVYNVIDSLKKHAQISQFIEIRARIKDIDSALNNNEKNKILDDVFGIEIICASEDEIHKIKNELEQAFVSTRPKFHDKPNGYKAWHESYSAKEDAKDTIRDWNLLEHDVPAVECQFKTIAVELNPEASHHDYKNVNKAEIQSKLEKEALIIGKQIPRMWVSRENGFYELEYKEIIQRLYPFIDVTTIKEPEKDKKILGENK